MLNLLGDLWFAGDAASPRSPAWDRVLALPGTHLHLYGKAPRRARKVGHITVRADSPAALEAPLRAIQALVAASEDG